MNNEADGPPCCMDHFLMARRLVEAGVRVVTISFGRWDTHGDNFRSNQERIPKLDMALSALIEDLHLRGLEKDVSVVVWGEFGRTPKINKDAGRDHWPPVNFALLAGGGMRHRQVIGSTDKHGGLSQGPSGHVPAGLRHALPQPRHRPRHPGPRPRRPADVPARRARAAAGSRLIGTGDWFTASNVYMNCTTAPRSLNRHRTRFRQTAIARNRI